MLHRVNDCHSIRSGVDVIGAGCFVTAGGEEQRESGKKDAEVLHASKIEEVGKAVVVRDGIPAKEFNPFGVAVHEDFSVTVIEVIQTCVHHELRRSSIMVTEKKREPQQP